MDNLVSKIGVNVFLGQAREAAIIDVRTPSEFKKGHIPGALNIPLFSDKERARVGTVYKQKGEEEAVLCGLDFVGPRMRAMLMEAKEIAGENKKLLVYCWRGGRRSESMAWLFSQGGIECKLLNGGYKNYRSYLLENLAKERNLIVVGGMTGSGKTEILKEIAARGEQVIDLEGLANHRGSAFGAIGMPPQPTSEHFANLLFDEFRRMDSSRRLFLEDESLNIGSVFMPDEFFKRIREALVIAVICNVKTRMPRLLTEYGEMPADKLKESISRIRKRLGGKETDEALESLSSGNMERAIELVLHYYDKTYSYGLGKRDKDKVIRIESDSSDAGINARKILDAANKIL